MSQTLIAISLATSFLGLAWGLSLKKPRFSYAFTVLQLCVFSYLAITHPWTEEYSHWGHWQHCLRHAVLLGSIPGTVNFIYGKRQHWSFVLGFSLMLSVPFHVFSGEGRNNVVWPPGRELDRGLVLQTTRMSCAPAAAASYLRLTGIRKNATEAELGKACHTDFRTGTKDKDLVTGLSAVSGRVAKISTVSYEKLKSRTGPCILFVGLSRDRAKSEELYRVLRDECGWLPGEAHTVVFLGIEKGRPGEDLEVVTVCDPRIGLERWGVSHFHALWDHRILTLETP